MNVPSKEVIRKEIDDVFSEVYEEGGNDVDYQGVDVLNWIEQTYVEDVKNLQLNSVYPDINLTREDQQALNISILYALGQSNYVELEFAPLKVNVVSTIAHNANVVNKTIGARYYKESEDDRYVVGEYLYYLANEPESRIYLNDNFTSV